MNKRAIIFGSASSMAIAAALCPWPWRFTFFIVGGSSNYYGPSSFGDFHVIAMAERQLFGSVGGSIDE